MHIMLFFWYLKKTEFNHLYIFQE